MTKARRVEVEVHYNGINVSKDFAKDLKSFSYVDNASGESDSISITLQDENEVWMNEWFANKSDQIRAIINTTNWKTQNDSERLLCGTFFIDMPELSGFPNEVTINAASVPANEQLMSRPRTQKWKGIGLKRIANDIAFRSGLGLEYLANNPWYGSKEQSGVTDAAFLAELCESEGLAMKVTNRKIIIFKESDFEKEKPVDSYHRKAGRVLSYSFNSDYSKGYAGVKLSYYDIKQKRRIEFLYTVRDISNTNEEEANKNKIYLLNTKVHTGEEARRAAQNKLRNLNKRETQVDLTLLGNVNLVGGSTLQLDGFGKFSGKYFIEQARHDVGSGGYTTQVRARKVLGG